MSRGPFHSTALNQLYAAISSLGTRALRIREDYQQRHVPGRCQAGGCGCPCGYCKHDRRHVPGGSGG
jgi:hypothetical protein